MACGHAKLTGRLGVCLATAGPGGLLLLSGLYDARLDGVPVLALTGLPPHDLIGTHCQQDVDLDRVFADACACSMRVMGPGHAEAGDQLACRTALATAAPPTWPSRLTCSPPRSAARPACRAMPGPRPPAAPVPVPPDEQASTAPPTVLNAGRRICILVGRGALGARGENSPPPPAAGRAGDRGAARQGRAARRQPLTSAAPGCSAPGRARTRWRAATRC